MTAPGEVSPVGGQVRSLFPLFPSAEGCEARPSLWLVLSEMLVRLA